MSIQQPLPFNPIIWPAVPHDFTGDLNLGYYTTELTQRYTWGTRGITWDGKVFKYARSKSTTIYSGMGAFNGASADISTLINSTSFEIKAGDRSTLITVGDTEGYGEGVVAENELVGAQFVIGHGGAATAETRTVIGNDAIADGGSTGMIYVDAPWAYNHTAGWMELPLNAYGYLINASEYGSVMGMPCRSTASVLLHLWIQTWGPCWCTPGSADTTPGDSAKDRTVYFTGDGSVTGGNVVISAALGNQIAGFIMDTTESAAGAMPMVMLQISI